MKAYNSTLVTNRGQPVNNKLAAHTIEEINKRTDPSFRAALPLLHTTARIPYYADDKVYAPAPQESFMGGVVSNQKIIVCVIIIVVLLLVIYGLQK
jgi:hypothetical protein